MRPVSCILGHHAFEIIFDEVREMEKRDTHWRFNGYVAEEKCTKCGWLRFTQNGFSCIKSK